MRRYSQKIHEEMGDQVLGENFEKTGADGMTITVQTNWTRDDEDRWPAAAQWLQEQFERLRAILSDPPGEAMGAPGPVSTSGEESASEISGNPA